MLVAALALSGSALADSESPLRVISDTSGIRYADTNGNAADSRVYIVQLRAPSVVERQIAAQPLLAKTRSSSTQAFSKLNPEASQYADKLVSDHDSLLARTGPGSRKIYSYKYSLNGFAALMTPAQAHKLENLAEVKQVWEDEIRPIYTNYSPQFLGLYDRDRGLRGAQALDGESVVIAVIDSGVSPEHPAFKDTREAYKPRLCRSSWAESSLLGKWLCRRFEKAADVLLFEPLDEWPGICETGESFDETNCNNKLLGARFFIDGAETTGAIDNGEFRSARDADGHGTHTATIAAGNRVSASIYGTFLGHVEGMAPRARLAVYKACWLRPGDLRASCNTSDLAQAIDAAVADGVDIINYSVGSSLRTTAAPDDIALMAAAKAGIFAAVAAGNDGPNLTTIGSPAGSPWVTTVAASSREGQRSVEAMQVTAPPAIAGKYAVREASFTRDLRDADPVEGQLVLVDDNDTVLEDGSDGTRMDACEPIVNDDEVSGKIAYIERGGCAFLTKIEHAEDAGAIAALVYNIAGDPIVMNGAAGFVDIPALMIGQADGNLLLSEIDAGNIVEVVLDKGLFLNESEDGNVMAAFSSRGPAPVRDILKPDITAPGINILAGFTPDAANTISGENFAYLSGTSMSTPHVAGVAALLREAHPQWTVGALKSALSTTAYRDVVQADGESQAHPFDFGSGHLNANDAFAPGLVFDAGADDYDAFSCGIESPAVDTARCESLAAAGWSFDADQFNLPSLAVSRLTNTRTITRRVTNVADEANSYVANVVAPPGISLTVSPNTLSPAPGASQEFEVTLENAGGAMNLWQFGSITWESNDHSVYMPVAVRPVVLTAPEEVESFGGTGNLQFNVDFGYSGSYAPGVHGLRKPLVVEGYVEEDPNKSFTFRNNNGVTAHLIDVPANQAYLRFALFDEFTDGEDDLDLYVYYCPDNINCTKVGESGEFTSEEEFNLVLPGGGRYAVLVHGFATDETAGGTGANYSLFAWAFGLVDDQGNMTASGPALVNAGATETVTVNWFGLEADTIYLGGISHNTPSGLSALTIVRIRN